MGFEGGQTPLQRQLPKLKGFKNPNRDPYVVVNVERLDRFEAGSTVSPAETTTPSVAPSGAAGDGRA